MSFFPMRIVLASDGSGDGLAAARTAAHIATLTRSALYVIRTWSPVGWEAHVLSLAANQVLPQEYFTQREKDARRDLETLLYHIEIFDGCATEAFLQAGDFVDTVLQFCRGFDAGLLVVDGRRRSLLRHLFIDTAAERITRHTSCPVLVL